MFSRLKKILSIFTLAVFLLPSIVEQLHAFEHQEDNHCTNTETHFCALEHHCTLCDFVKLTSDTFLSDDQLNDDLILTSHNVTFYQTFSPEQHKFNYSLRGPPSVC